MRCPKCATMLRVGQTTCPNCGTPVAEQAAVSIPGLNTCSKCGTILKDGVKFCPSCGTPAAAPAPAPVPVPEPTPAPVEEPKAEEPAKCPSCGSSLKPGAKFCPVCGSKAGEAAVAPIPAPIEEPTPVEEPAPAPVEEPKAEEPAKCPSCGSSLKPGAKFCPVCGSKVGEAAVAPVPAPIEEPTPVEEPAPAPVEEPKTEESEKCPTCGNTLKPGAKFCPACGTKIAAAAVGAAAVGTAAAVGAANMNAPAPAPVGAANMNAPAPAPVGAANMNSPAPDPVGPANVNAAAPAPVGAQSVQTQTKKKKINPLFIILPIIGVVLILGILLIVIIVIVGAIASTPQKINIDDYVTMSYEGIDGRGTASVRIDQKKFYEDWKDKLSYKKDPKETSFYYDIDKDNAASFIYYFMEYSYDTSNTYDLSNGDTVRFRWTMSDYVKDTIKEYVNVEVEYSDEKEFTVSGLSDIPVIDPFDGLKVTFTGKSGAGYIDINTDNVKAGDYYISYKADNTYSLKNGDKVVITAECYDEESGSVKLKNKTKEYTVSGLMGPVNKVADIPAAALDEMKAAAVENIQKDISYSSYCTFKSADYIGTIIAADNEGRGDYYTYNTVYKVTVDCKNKDSKKKNFDLSYYTYCRFSGLYTGTDGGYELDSYSNITYNTLSVENSYASVDGFEDYNALYSYVEKNNDNCTLDTDIVSAVPQTSTPETEESSSEDSKPEESDPDESNPEGSGPEESEPEESAMTFSLEELVENTGYAETQDSTLTFGGKDYDATEKLFVEGDNEVIHQIVFKEKQDASKMKSLIEKNLAEEETITAVLEFLKEGSGRDDVKYTVQVLNADGNTIFKKTYS